MKKRKLELYITGKLMSALMVGRPAIFSTGGEMYQKSVRYYMKNKFSVLIVLYCTKKCNNNNYKAYPRPCFKSTRYIIQKFVYA